MFHVEQFYLPKYRSEKFCVSEMFHVEQFQYNMLRIAGIDFIIENEVYVYVVLNYLFTTDNFRPYRTIVIT